jgi:hypothetical protein
MRNFGKCLPEEKKFSIIPISLHYLERPKEKERKMGFSSMPAKNASN